MATWKPIVGLSFDAKSFDRYVRGLTWTAWRPNFVVLHNTGVPNVSMRPQGFTRQHIDNLVGYYRDTQKWRAGPHLFIDDRQIWVFTPLTTAGVHSPSWNQLALGIEMLGDYAHDDPATGRGAKVYANAIAAVASLSRTLGLDPDSLRLHKEDKATTHDCPGRLIVKKKVIADVRAILVGQGGEEHVPGDPHPD